MPIKFVSTAVLDKESAALAAHWSSRPGKFETWERFHDLLQGVAAKYGTVSWDPTPLPDFYFSGDWFHENSDGFSISSSKALSLESLRDFQKVVAAHHPHAQLHLSGTADPIDGLGILITPSKILVAWNDSTPRDCKEKLQSLGVLLE